MNYNDLLNELIDNTKMTLNALVKALQEKSIKVTANYLSILKNSSDKYASDELNIAIAEICNAKYREVLVVQKYYDNAPEIVQKIFESVGNFGMSMANEFLMSPLMRGKITNEQINLYNTKIDSRKQRPIAEQVLEMIYLEKNSSFSSLFKDINEIDTKLIANKIKDGDWLLVPVRSDAQPFSIPSNQAKKLINILNSDIS